MRIIIPIGDAEELDEDDLKRMMQTNFDSALDARYALGCVHPSAKHVDRHEFLVGLGEIADVVLSYGSSYSSGLFIYGNGDSTEIERRRLIEELRKTET